MDFNINKEFIITFQPKQADPKGRRRFSIGGKSLHKYIGSQNALQAIRKAFDFQGDKLTLKYRKFGRIDFYRK